MSHPDENHDPRADAMARALSYAPGHWVRVLHDEVLELRREVANAHAEAVQLRAAQPAPAMPWKEDVRLGVVRVAQRRTVWELVRSRFRVRIGKGGRA